MAAAKKKPTKTQDQVESLYVEPPLMHRLFPTLMKGKAPSEKALAKAAERAKKKPSKALKPRLPIADLLPSALILEVRKRDVARLFFLLWGGALAIVAAAWFVLGINVSTEKEKFDAAESTLQNAQLNYAKVAPYLSYAKEIGAAGQFANDEALKQIDNAAAIQLMNKIVGDKATVTTYTITYGATGEGATCSSVTAGGGGIFDVSEGAPTGIGCLAFTATSPSVAVADAMSAALRATPGVVGATVKPGELNEAGDVVMTVEALLGEQFQMKPGLGVTVPLESLDADSLPKPATTADDTEGVTP